MSLSCHGSRNPSSDNRKWGTHHRRCTVLQHSPKSRVKILLKISEPWTMNMQIRLQEKFFKKISGYYSNCFPRDRIFSTPWSELPATITMKIRTCWKNTEESPVAPPFNPNTWDDETAGLPRVWDQPEVHSEFWAILNYIQISPLKKTMEFLLQNITKSMTFDIFVNIWRKTWTRTKTINRNRQEDNSAAELIDKNLKGVLITIFIDIWFEENKLTMIQGWKISTKAHKLQEKNKMTTRKL